MENVLIKSSQKEMDYTDFVSFLFMNQDEQFLIIENEEYNRFMNSKNKDDVMEMRITEYDNFYEQAFNMDMWSFEDQFKSATYTNERENQMLLTLKDNGVYKKFVIDIA